MFFRLTQIARSPSKSFAAALVCFVLGVGVGPFVVSSASWIVAASAVLFAATAFVAEKRTRLAMLMAGALLMGVWRYGLTAIPPELLSVAEAAGRSTRFSGIVAGEPERRIGGQRAILEDVSVVDASASGKLLVWLDAYPTVAHGDRLTFACNADLPEPIESFRYDRYLASQGIAAVCFYPQHVDAESAPPSLLGGILSVKRAVVARLGLLVPEPHASFLAGLLFGGSSALSPELKDDFASTGTSHILAASGFNVSLFSLVFLYWITHTALGRKRGAYVTAALLVVYVLVAGATAAVVRAGVMGGLVLLAFVVRRKPSVLNVTLVALAGMLAWNPLLLRDDVGFQLSFVATAAMLGFASRIEKLCAFVPAWFGLRASFAGSLAAVVATLPLLLWHFGSVSPFTPVVNLLVLPLVPLLMAITGIALAAGFVFIPLGVIAAVPAWAISSVILHVISWFGAV